MNDCCEKCACKMEQKHRKCHDQNCKCHQENKAYMHPCVIAPYYCGVCSRGTNACREEHQENNPSMEWEKSMKETFRLFNGGEFCGLCGVNPEELKDFIRETLKENTDSSYTKGFNDALLTLDRRLTAQREEYKKRIENIIIKSTAETDNEMEAIVRELWETNIKPAVLEAISK